MKLGRGFLITTVAAAAVVLLAESALLLAKPGVVRTRAGQVYEGDVDERGGAEIVTVTVRGIRTNIARENVQSITYGQGADVEYKERLAALDPKDFRGRMDLAKWAFAQKRYDLARDAADKALEVDPNSAEATNFLTLVQSQQRMERARDNGTTTNPSESGTRRPATTRGNGIEWVLLTEQDMNRIRQEELRKIDTRVRFQFRNDVERRFLSAHRDLTLLDWRAMSPLDRAIAILDRGEPSMRDDVILTSEPSAILDYRRIVQPIVQANCATAACHGGANAGPLVLNTTADVNDAAAYTNYYILNRYVSKQKATGDQQGVFAGATVERRMIDRMHPEDSLLLQYGLPRNQARMPHPDVQGLRPAYPRGREDTRYQAVWRWIAQGLLPIEPNYGIEYRPPVGTRPGTVSPGGAAPATAPVSQPVRKR